MGAVYRVFDEMVGEEVALKILTDGNLAASERFRAEVRLARRITHRNVGRTFDIGTDRGLLFITMELIEGHTVLDWLNRGVWSDADVAWLASSAALGLAAAHQAEVVHRDLKPSNLLVTRDERVVLIDWGIAAFRYGGEHGIAGTPDYMAPEQLLGEPPAPAQDIYSLGLVMFELLAHERPFPGASSTERAQARLNQEPAFSLLPSGSALTPILRRCLSRDPAARPRATELEALLRPISKDFKAPPSHGGPELQSVSAEAPTRMEPSAPSSLGSLSHSALMAYLRGLTLFRSPARSFKESFEALSECVELAPQFLPAVAARALAASFVRVYLLSSSGPQPELDEAVALAEERANHLADTHVARGLLQLRDADFAAGVRSLTEAVRLDPRHARAHEHLGRIECEAGHAERGVRRILGALSLDPAFRAALSLVGRAYALRGRVDLLDEALALSATMGPVTYEEAVLEARFACWWGDKARASKLLSKLGELSVGSPLPLQTATSIARATLDHSELWGLREQFRQPLTLGRRLLLSRTQAAAEVEGAIGDPMQSLDLLEQADQAGLVDIEWLAHCPAFEVVRDHERFERVLHDVRLRAQSLWTTPLSALPPVG
jgi:tetratricopeptide (TPR) repeat protein